MKLSRHDKENMLNILVVIDRAKHLRAHLLVCATAMAAAVAPVTVTVRDNRFVVEKGSSLTMRFAYAGLYALNAATADDVSGKHA